MAGYTTGETGAGIALIIFPIVPIFIDQDVGSAFLVIPMYGFKRKGSCHAPFGIARRF